jgi:hypothetical protein
VGVWLMRYMAARKASSQYFNGMEAWASRSKLKVHLDPLVGFGA